MVLVRSRCRHAEGVLRLRPVEEVALHIQDLAGSDRRQVDVGWAQQ